MASSVSGPVRVRFAPSPTGHLHVGGARTAIYNELLRYSVGGAFVLRIEDTDVARSDARMTRQIEEALAWLGVEWDEGPHLQSERVDHHRCAVDTLLASERAYRCFCTPEELAEQRRAADAAGHPFRYPGTCAELAPREVEERMGAGEPYTVRFRLRPGDIEFFDLVRGEMSFDAEVLDDFILLRSDGSPTYHLSVVVDDVEMGITHVIRGEDHLSNTPKHIRLFEALDAEVPTFAHLPLILGEDRKRLSKRTGATSVEEFRDEGILPSALYNYLCLLGWSPGDDREVMGKEEIVEAFTVERLVASPSVFDRDKLGWMNAQHMSEVDADSLHEHLRPFLEEAGLAVAIGSDRLRSAVALHRTRARTLRELAEAVRPYFVEELDYEEREAEKFLRKDPELADHLAELCDRYAEAESFTIEELERILRAYVAERDASAGTLIHPTRYAVSASRVGPPLFDLLEALGREATLGHMDRYVAELRDAGG